MRFMFALNVRHYISKAVIGIGICHKICVIDDTCRTCTHVNLEFGTSIIDLEVFMYAYCAIAMCSYQDRFI